MSDIDTAAIRADVLCSADRAWPVIIIQLCEALDAARAEAKKYRGAAVLEARANARAEAAEAEVANLTMHDAVVEWRKAEARIARALGYVGGFGCDSCVRKDRALTGETS